MNKIAVFLGVALIAIIGAFFLFQDEKEVMTAGKSDKLKVGFVYLTNPGDHGWTYAHEVGRQQLQKHFGNKIETTFVENVPEGPDAARVIRDLVAQDNKVIFTTSFGYMEPTLKVAKEYPDVMFDHITGYKRAPNMATGNIRFYEGRYVQGVVAGLTTKSNTIGYLGAFPIPEVIQGINSFARGLRSVNKEASIKVVWVNSWYDPVKESDAAKVLIAEGADVLAQHTDSPAMLQTAEKAGVKGFGQSSDMHEFAPKAQLFSSVNNWGPYYISQVQKVLDGKWSTGDGPDHWAGNTWKGIGDDFLVLTEFKNMPASVAEKAETVRAGIAAGTLNIFEGPMKDNQGNMVLDAGKVLDDGGLWGMNYYVEGVEGSIPN
ncbi:MAG: BMP family ABC transporter substrate-binding protein [Alphaproteobacteria bacterium]|nr:BMP family ABC transporter substrate-binding protein [Alphaproteobacteria bacterium]MBL6777343.1 BMP family ABC transporter substrate-binding protein [Alphaproteobacteria bacterium]